MFHLLVPREGSGLKQMLSGDLLVSSVQYTAPLWGPQLDHMCSSESNYLSMWQDAGC